MEIIKRLEELNFRFYEHFASDFDQTRSYGWAGWTPLLNLLPPSSDLKVVDLGCGNGRLAQFLARQYCTQKNNTVRQYIGLDRSPTLLEYARSIDLPFDTHWQKWDWGELFTPQNYPIDITAPSLKEAGWVTLFGVLHHVYGYQRRLKLIKWAASHLSIGGILTLSLWDFGAHPRWDKKKISHDQFQSEWGIDPTQLESGDVLLGWSGDFSTPRYCHWVDREEELRLLRDVQDQCPQIKSGQLVHTEGDFNRYLCWFA